VAPCLTLCVLVAASGLCCECGEAKAMLRVADHLRAGGRLLCEWCCGNAASLRQCDPPDGLSAIEACIGAPIRGSKASSECGQDNELDGHHRGSIHTYSCCQPPSHPTALLGHLREQEHDKNPIAHLPQPIKNRVPRRGRHAATRPLSQPGFSWL